MTDSPIQINPNLEHAVAWSIFAELLRRHPGELELWMDYYLNGGQMLSASRRDRSIHVSLNYSGGGLWVRDSGRHFRLEEPVWQIALQSNARVASAVLERALRLDPVQETPSSTQTTLVPRVIAGFMCRHALSSRRWAVHAIHQAESDGTDAHRRILRSSGHLHQLDTRCPIAAWQVSGGMGQVAATISHTGVAVTHDLRCLDLSLAYKAADRKLDSLIDDVFGPH